MTFRSSTLRTILTVLLLSLPLTSCIKGSSSGPGVCPPLKGYSAEFQEELAQELEQIIKDKQYPAIQQVVTDYGVTRKDIRTCIARTTPGA